MRSLRRAVILLVIALFALAVPVEAQAAKSFKVLGGKLVIFGGPKGELKDGKVRVWWDYSWYFRLGGKKVAEGKGKVFDVTVSGDGGTFKEEYEHNGLVLKVDGEVEGNEIHIDVTGKFTYKGQSADIGSLELSGRVGG